LDGDGLQGWGKSKDLNDHLLAQKWFGNVIASVTKFKGYWKIQVITFTPRVLKKTLRGDNIHHKTLNYDCTKGT